MTPRRIAYVVNTFPKFSETFIAGELAALRARRVEVRILSLKPPPDGPQHAIVSRAGLLERTTYDAAQFRRVLDDFKPDMIHAHFATQPTELARDLAADLAVPFTFTAHGYDVYRRPPTDFAARATAAAAVITVSDANRLHITNTFGVPASRIHVIPCGIDTDWFSPAGRRPAGVPRIVCVARLHPVKALDVLLRACARLRDRGVAFECVVVGEGAERPMLESLRDALGLRDRVALQGAAEQSEVRRWWRRASIAVLSSRSEGMPVCLMEAAACGVPAVAPGVGGIPELIEDGITGLVTRPNDPVDTADALQYLLNRAALRDWMGSAARKRADALFSRRRQIARLSAIWSRAVH